jgi:hypothetical protein
MNHKQSMNSWRKFLTEATNPAAAVPARKRASVPDGAWPMLRPGTAGIAALSSASLRAARAALGGKSKSDLEPKDIFALHQSLERADISLSADLMTIVGKNKCKDTESASAVILGFDLSEPVPAHEFIIQIGFQTEAYFDQFIKLLTSGAKSSSTMGTLGQVPAFYVPPPGTGTETPYAIPEAKAKVTVGVSPVWNHHTQQQERAVVLAWGDIGEGHTSKGGPYFIYPDAAAAMAKEWLRLAAPLIKRNDGDVYQYPSTLPVPDQLTADCEQEAADRRRLAVRGPKRTKDLQMTSPSGRKISI